MYRWKETPACFDSRRLEQLKLSSCCEQNHTILIKLWREKSQLVDNVQVGEFINVTALMCSTFNTSRFLTSTEDTLVNVS